MFSEDLKNIVINIYSKTKSFRIVSKLVYDLLVTHRVSDYNFGTSISKSTIHRWVRNIKNNNSEDKIKYFNTIIDFIKIYQDYNDSLTTLFHFFFLKKNERLWRAKC